MMLRYMCLLLISCGVWAGCGKPAAAPTAEGPEQLLFPGSLEPAYASLETQAEELERARHLDAREDLALLDTHVHNALGAAAPAQDEQTAFALLGYVSQRLKLGPCKARTATEYLQEGQGFCTGFATVFTALSQRAGFPARMNSFNNIELMQGHNAVEVYYAGAWHFLDPAFGAFFYSLPDYNGQGTIASLHELLTEPAARRHLFLVTTHLWEGECLPAAPPVPAPEDYLVKRYGYSLAGFYDRVFSVSFPTAESGDVACSYPMDAHLEQQTELWIGNVDGQVEDVFEKQPDGRYPRFRGASHLGKTRYQTAYHTLTLYTSGPGEYRVTYHFSGGQHDALGVIELKNVVVKTVSETADTYSILCRVQAQEATLLVVNRKGQAYVDALHFESCLKE